MFSDHSRKSKTTHDRQSYKWLLVWNNEYCYVKPVNNAPLKQACQCPPCFWRKVMWRGGWHRRSQEFSDKTRIIKYSTTNCKRWFEKNSTVKQQTSVYQVLRNTLTSAVWRWWRMVSFTTVCRRWLWVGKSYWQPSKWPPFAQIYFFTFGTESGNSISKYDFERSGQLLTPPLYN